MRTNQLIHLVSCHAEGEVGNVIVGGVPPPPGDTIWEQARWIAKDERLRQFVLNEPRGGVFKHINLLVPPKHPRAACGFIVMEPMHTPPMSGSNSICVATVLLDTGMIEMREPETSFYLEAPAGLVRVRAYCAKGKAESIEVWNEPSFVDRLDAKLELEGYGTLSVDIAYGGDSFVLVDARSHWDSRSCRTKRRSWRKPVERSSPPLTNRSVFSIRFTGNGITSHSASSRCLSSVKTAL